MKNMYNNINFVEPDDVSGSEIGALERRVNMNPVKDPTFDAKDEPIRVVLVAAARAVPQNWQHLRDWQTLDRRIVRVRDWRLVYLYLMPVQFRIDGDAIYLASDGDIYRYHYEQGQPSTSGGASAPSWSSYRRMGRRQLRSCTPDQLSLLADALSSMAWGQ